jgi:hypothetical protein
MVEEMPALKLYLATSLMKVTAAHEPTGLDAMLDLLEGTVPRQSLLRAAIHDLPEAQRPAVLTWIQTSLKGKEAGSALMGLALGIDDNAVAKTLMNEAMQWLDPDAMTYLKSIPDFRELMFRGVGPDSPMEERIAAKLAGPVEGKTAEERRENAWKSLISEDVTRWLGTNQLADTVQTGGMSATELWHESNLRSRCNAFHFSSRPTRWCLGSATAGTGQRRCRTRLRRPLQQVPPGLPRSRRHVKWDVSPIRPGNRRGPPANAAKPGWR